MLLPAIEVFFATQQLENGRNSQQIADFQPKLATITKFLAATCNNYLQPGKIRVESATGGVIDRKAHV